MDLNDTPEFAQYRARVRAFLEKNAVRRDRRNFAWQSPPSPQELVSAARAWQSKRAAAGFAGITVQREYGGQGATPLHQIVYSQEEDEFVVPRGVFDIGFGMCIPTMLRYASAPQLERHVPAALKGDDIWCQLFSEPGAGSDLAGVRCRADREGDGWRINGQKIWTSGAHFSDWGLLVARSDFGARKHEGLTAFFIDMKSPGIEVRRVKQASGNSHFCEVFFTDLIVPDAQRLGEVNGGWSVALSTLINERLASGRDQQPDVDAALTFARGLGDAPGGLHDSATRERLARWYIQAAGVRYTRFRVITKLAQGELPGLESSITKLVVANKLQEIAAHGIDLQGPEGIITDPDAAPFNALFQQGWLWAPGVRIAGGTDEILRNIIAERILGLPPEPRPDKGTSFNRIGVREGAAA